MIEEKILVALDDVDDPWEFVIEAAAKYKKEFRKTAKIGTPPKIDDIIAKTVLGIEEETEDIAAEENKDEKTEVLSV